MIYQLICVGGVVVGYATPSDVLPSALPAGAVVIPYDGELTALERVGDPPPAGSADTRLYAAPAVNLTAYAAAARYAKETGGITVAGMAIATDDRSKILISGARQGADADASFTTPFVAGGSITTLNATQVIALSNAVLAHVQACFSAYAQVVQGIAAGKIKTTADVDAVFSAVTA